MREPRRPSRLKEWGDFALMVLLLPAALVALPCIAGVVWRELQHRKRRA